MRKICLFLIFTLNLNAILLFSIFDESKFDDESIKKYVMSEKFDGVRALWDAKSLKTRNDFLIKTPINFTRNFPPFALDGELVLKNASFDAISALIRSDDLSEDKWQNAVYMVFDAPNACEDFKLEICSLQNRLQILAEFLKKQNLNTNIKIIKQIKIESKSHLNAYYNEVLARGGEGLIIRKNELEYENERSKFAFKLKPFLDAECKVLAYTQGKGKFQGKVGALICENVGDKKVFKIGSGLKNKDRENPPAIGSIITYKFNGFTKNGLPRFPVFLRIR